MATKTIKYKAIRAKMKDKPFTMKAAGRDAEVVVKVVNMGIDSCLEACFVPDRGDSYIREGHRLWCVVSPESLPVLLRRLTEFEYAGEDGDDNDVGWSLATAILESYGFEVETMCYGIEP